MKTPENMKRNPGGFTLVELLVVIAIVATLAAIVGLGVSKAKMSAKRVISISNLKQLGLLTQMYSSDNNGKLVPGKDSSNKEWYVNLGSYADPNTNFAGPWSFFNFNPFKMKPQLEYFQIPTAWPASVTSGYWQFGYGINMQPGLPQITLQNTGEGWGKGFKMAAIEHPERRILIAEWPEWNMRGTNAADVRRYAAMQDGKLRAIFFDGHCSPLTPEEFLAANSPR